MKIPVMRLPISVDNPSLPMVSPSDLSLIRPYEDSAIGHWVFGGSAASLQSRVGTRRLVATGSPTYDAACINLTGPAGTYLTSDIFDLPEMTVVTVFQKPTDDGTKQHALWGNLIGGLQGQECVIRGDERIASTAIASGTTAAPTTPIYFAATSAFGSMVDGSWYATGTVCRSGVADMPDVYAMALGTAWTSVNLGGYVMPLVRNASSPLRVGASVLLNNDSANVRKIAEWMVFGRALSQAEMLGVFYRAQIRQAQRGNAVVM